MDARRGAGYSAPMPSITEALAEIEPGTEVHLRLADGSTVVGTFQGMRADRVGLDDADDVELDQVVDVGRRVTTDGVE